MAAVVIPVLIHLFNRSRGRLVRIGHIDLVRNARKLKVTELKLAQWLLLLLRIALFVLAGLILAGLARPGLQSDSFDTAYVTPAWLANSSAIETADLLKRYADSKTSRIFVLQEGYPLLDLDLAASYRSEEFAEVEINNIWPLLADRLSVQHHQGEVEVYAVDLLQQFGSIRPTLPRDVQWQLKHPAQSDWTDEAIITVTIAFDPAHQSDAAIVRAALISLKAHRLPGLSLEMVLMDQLTTAQLHSDWLILLSDSGLSEEQFSQITSPVTILSDANPGNENDDDNEANQMEYLRLPYYPFTRFRAKLIANANDSLYSQLSNSAGLPVMQTGQRGNARLVQFNSRFDKRWSTISAQTTFPELLLQLMQSNGQQQHSFTNARVLAEQLRGANVPTAVTPAPLPRHSMQQFLAMLMIFLWLLERWLSERRRRE